jgi:hypothetical protein
MYYHYCIWSDGGTFDMSGPVFDTHSRGVAIALGSTGSIDDAVMQGYADTNNDAFALYTESTTNVIVNKAKIIGFGSGVYKSSSKTSENKVQFRNCTIDGCTYAVYAKYGEVFKNCLITDCGTAFYTPDALGHQDAPDHITWDGNGTLYTDYTAPTHLTTGAPEYSDSDLHIAYTSAARGAGIAIPGLTLDSDGVPYADPPACGVYEASGYNLIETAGGLRAIQDSLLTASATVADTPRLLMAQGNDMLAGAASPLYWGRLRCTDPATIIYPPIPGLTGLEVWCADACDIVVTDGVTEIASKTLAAGWNSVPFSAPTSTSGDITVEVDGVDGYFLITPVSVLSVEASPDPLLDCAAESAGYLQYTRFPGDDDQPLSVDTMDRMMLGITAMATRPQILMAWADGGGVARVVSMFISDFLIRPRQGAKLGMTVIADIDVGQTLTLQCGTLSATVDGTGAIATLSAETDDTFDSTALRTCRLVASAIADDDSMTIYSITVYEVW